MVVPGHPVSSRFMGNIMGSLSQHHSSLASSGVFIFQRRFYFPGFFCGKKNDHLPEKRRGKVVRAVHQTIKKGVSHAVSFSLSQLFSHQSNNSLSNDVDHYCPYGDYFFEVLQIREAIRRWKLLVSHFRSYFLFSFFH